MATKYIIIQDDHYLTEKGFHSYWTAHIDRAKTFKTIDEAHSYSNHGHVPDWSNTKVCKLITTYAVEEIE